MADPHAKPISPMSHVLQSLGMTKDDLHRHSKQMRQFLTTEGDSSQRVSSQDRPFVQSSNSHLLSRSTSTPDVSPFLSPPRTPVKAEPVDTALPLRHFDSMEAVIERKSRKSKRDKKGRKDRERTAPIPFPTSPSPAAAVVNMDSFLQSRSRDVGRVSVPEAIQSSRGVTPQEPLPVAPATPQPRKYYREHTADASIPRLRTATFSPRPESPTPTRHRTFPPAQDPITPRNHNNKYYKFPMLSSSPPPQSSPLASPSRTIVNIVSSPGPMGPPPGDDDCDELPYTLPPGPYSNAKPEFSYAALVGQAVLSSPQHRLTLQEIYEWITTVYPYFKRGETTWMNSIRHVLSTTACFRKVMRERSEGRTQWAIWDEDLECFANGGFRKQFCADMVAEAGRSRSAQKKRPAEDSFPRKAKRARKSVTEKNTTADAGPRPQPAILHPPPLSHAHVLFPPMRPTVHHQPYYPSYIPPVMPAEVIFPPLPSSIYRVASSAPSSEELPYPSTSPSSPPPSYSSSALLPSLTSNCSSSSPPLPSEHATPDQEEIVIREADASDGISGDGLEPGFMLRENERRTDKGKQKQETQPTRRSHALPPAPTSPTLERQRSRPPRVTSRTGTPPLPTTPVRLITPPKQPSTPTRSHDDLTSTYLNLSPIRTPLSHKGLHMSPSPSLAHYKSHLNPPPFATFIDPGGYLGENSMHDTSIFPFPVVDAENVRTPTRKCNSSSHVPNIFSGPPLTPRKLVFPTAGAPQDSPYRTPGARQYIFDPHDPGALLDEELSRMGAQGGSPSGIYAGSRGMLYESPSAGSPGRWMRW